MHQLPLTELLNHLFAGPVTALLTALGIHPLHPTAPIPDHFAMELLVFVVLLAFFIAVRASLSVEKPGTLQHMMEVFYNLMDAQGEEIIGHSSRKYLSYLITLALFILCSNLLGLIPFLESPTAVPMVPLGCAVVTWVFYHLQGFRNRVEVLWEWFWSYVTFQRGARLITGQSNSIVPPPAIAVPERNPSEVDFQKRKAS